VVMCTILVEVLDKKPTPTFSDIPFRHFPRNIIGKILYCRLILIPSEFRCGCFTWRFSTVKDPRKWELMNHWFCT
jgi:hypothetical protein